MPTVALARFEDLIAHGLRALIAGDDNLELVASDIAPGDLATVIEELAPEVVVLNFGSLPSAGAVHSMHRRYPHTRLVVMANRPTQIECSQLLAFGATACLSKETQARDILNAIHLASRGLQVLPHSGPAPDGPDLLTPREAEVLELLQQGRSNAEIALQLQVGIETVRTHARNIYRKLGVRTRRDLAATR